MSKGQGSPAPRAIQTRIRQMIEEQGTKKVAEDIGVSREALARIAAGLDVRRGTLALVESALEKKP